MHSYKPLMKWQWHWQCMRTSTVFSVPHSLKMDLFGRCITRLRGVLRVVFKLMSTSESTFTIMGTFWWNHSTYLYFINFSIAFWLRSVHNAAKFETISYCFYYFYAPSLTIMQLDSRWLLYAFHCCKKRGAWTFCLTFFFCAPQRKERHKLFLKANSYFSFASAETHA